MILEAVTRNDECVSGPGCGGWVEVSEQIYENESKELVHMRGPQTMQPDQTPDLKSAHFLQRPAAPCLLSPGALKSQPSWCPVFLSSPFLPIHLSHEPEESV